MERLTCPAQGYCEMYCKEYGYCFSEPEICDFFKAVQMYERLKDYETTGLTPEQIKDMAENTEPVRHGRWVVTEQENGCAIWTDFKCSVCGAVFDGNEWLFDKWKGCPVCLSRLDGDKGKTSKNLQSDIF